MNPAEMLANSGAVRTHFAIFTTEKPAIHNPVQEEARKKSCKVKVI